MKGRRKGRKGDKKGEGERERDMKGRIRGEKDVNRGGTMINRKGRKGRMDMVERGKKKES